MQSSSVGQGTAQKAIDGSKYQVSFWYFKFYFGTPKIKIKQKNLDFLQK